MCAGWKVAGIAGKRASREASRQSTGFLFIAQLTSGRFDEASLVTDHPGALGAKEFDEKSVGALMIHAGAAGLEGHSDKVVLRPGMNGQVRFGNGDRPADAPGFKGIK